jgi:hypothetical protein
MFICAMCVYESDHAGNFRRHLLSAGHVAKCSDNNTCPKCLVGFKNKSGLTNHTKTCEAELCPKKYKQKITNISGDHSKSAEVINDNSTNINVTGDLHIHGDVDAQKALSSFVCSLKDMKSESSNIKKRVVHQMEIKPKIDIMYYIDLFDREVESEISDRNRYIEEQFCPELYGRLSKQEALDAPLDRMKLRRVLTSVLLSDVQNIVVMHRHDGFLGELIDILYKFENAMHDKEALIEFIKRSKSFRAGRIRIEDESFDVDKDEYKKYWKILCDHALSECNKHNNLMSIRRSQL